MKTDQVPHSKVDFEIQKSINSFQNIDLFFNKYKNLCKKYQFYIADGSIFPVESSVELERSFVELSKNLYTFW